MISALGGDAITIDHLGRQIEYVHLPMDPKATLLVTSASHRTSDEDLLFLTSCSKSRSLFRCLGNAAPEQIVPWKK
jgi:hypothetical protein